jgi:hypothetical protein
MSGSEPANPNYSGKDDPGRYITRCSMELIKPLSVQGKNAETKRVDHDRGRTGEQTPSDTFRRPRSINRLSE